MASFDVFNPLVFSPMSLSPALWLDAADQSTMYQERTGASATTLVASNADPVGSWLDKSGNGRHMTAPSDAARPTYRVNTQNGRSSMLFDGTDDNLNLGNLFGLSSDCSTFFVFKVSSGNFVPVFNATNGIGYLLVGDTSANSYRDNYGTPTVYKNGSTYSGTTRSNVRTDFFTNSAVIYSDTGGNYSAWTTNLQLNNYGGGYGRAASYYEMIIYPSVLSASKRQQVERYLANKWGITLS